MLSQDDRDLLIKTILGALRELPCEILVNSVQPGAWNAVPGDASYADAVALVVSNAEGQGWLRKLVERLVKDYPGRPEFAKVLAAIDQSAADGPSLRDRVRNLTPSPILSALSWLFGALAGQMKFFTGLLACLLLVVAFLVFMPDDEIAIKPIDESGKLAEFVNLQYDTKVVPPGGLRFKILKPDSGRLFPDSAQRDRGAAADRPDP